MAHDLFDLYLHYRRDTEPPVIFHRWALTACIGAWLGRQVWIPFGSNRIFANQFVMFIGDPGSRKTTAIKMATSIIRTSGYSTYSAQRTSKEKFLLDLAGEPEEVHDLRGKKGMELLDNISVLEVNDGTPREILIDADEFNNFMGPGNIEFQSILGELWDWDNPDVGYRFRLKNSRSIDICQPTISILAGNTPSNFALCFPPASIGQGFMSRLLLIHGETTGRKITFPEEPPAELKEELVRMFLLMKQRLHGKIVISAEARDMLDTIYKTWPDLEDLRFKHYSTRRFTHLLKLCIIYAAARLSQTIDGVDVIRANTVLAYSETLMPKALGELGKSKNSEAANKIMQALFATKKPLDFHRLWKEVQRDLEKPADLTQVLANLQYADQIIVTKFDGGKGDVIGYLPKAKGLDRKVMYVNYDYLKGKEIA